MINLTEDDFRKKGGVNRLLTHWQSSLLLSAVRILCVFQLEMKAVGAEGKFAD